MPPNSGGFFRTNVFFISITLQKQIIILKKSLTKFSEENTFKFLYFNIL